MAHRAFHRLRLISVRRGRALVLAAIPFLVLEGLCRYLESNNIPIAVNVAIRPGYVWLFAVCAIYGLARVAAIHPIWNSGYHAWLELTPWTSEKSLPLGPVELVWEDGLIVGLLILLSATLPHPHAVHLLCAFLLSHLLALTVTLFLTGTWAIGYAAAFALGLPVWLWRAPLPCLAAATFVYLLAYEGLRRGLEQFPWKRPERPRAEADLLSMGVPSTPLGWPYDRMLRDVVGDHKISRIDAVLCCMLLGWWLVVLSSFMDVSDRRVVLAAVYLGGLALCPIFRLYIYVKGYIFPITLWARIWTGRWILPGYDQVFVAPICSFLAGLLSLLLLREASVPLEIALPSATALTLLVALVMPPRLRHWRLTGRHRIVPALAFASSQSNTEFIKVG